MSAIFVAVEEPTGAGRTTLTARLAIELGAITVFDPFDANPFSPQPSPRRSPPTRLPPPGLTAASLAYRRAHRDGAVVGQWIPCVPQLMADSGHAGGLACRSTCCDHVEKPKLPGHTINFEGLVRSEFDR